MPTRTVLFRLMLWSLGLAAATGVLAVLFQGGDLVWRVVGTGLATAGACGLLIPTSALVDRERTRAAGLLGMSVIIFEFLLAHGLIWEVLQSLSPRSRLEGEWIISMVLIGLATPIMMVSVAMRRSSPHFLAGVVAAFTSVGALTSFLLAIWLPQFYFNYNYRLGERFGGTGGTILLLGALGTLSLLQLTAETPRRWRWLGIATSLAACFMLLQHIWIGVESDLGSVVFCGLLAAGCVVSHANACMVLPLKIAQALIRQGTILFAMLTAAFVVLLVAKDKFREIPMDADLIGRFTAAGGIIMGCGTLALMVLARMNRKVEAEPGSVDFSEVTLFCPRCRRKHSLPIGDSICPSCGLRICIRTEEPRCAKCDYLLRGLTSDRCPECGAPIAT